MHRSSSGSENALRRLLPEIENVENKKMKWKEPCSFKYLKEHGQGRSQEFIGGGARWGQ